MFAVKCLLRSLPISPHRNIQVCPSKHGGQWYRGSQVCLLCRFSLLCRFRSGKNMQNTAASSYHLEYRVYISICLASCISTGCRQCKPGEFCRLPRHSWRPSGAARSPARLTRSKLPLPQYIFTCTNISCYLYGRRKVLWRFISFTMHYIIQISLLWQNKPKMIFEEYKQTKKTFYTNTKKYLRRSDSDAMQIKVHVRRRPSLKLQLQLWQLMCSLWPDQVLGSL